MTAQNGKDIDFTNLSNHETDRIVEAVRVIATYNDEAKQVKECIRDVLEKTAFDLGADKESTKKLKKYIRKAAAIYWSNKIEENLIDNTCVENIIAKVETKNQQQEDTI